MGAGAAVEARDVILVGPAVGRDVAAGAVETADRSVGPGVFCTAGPEFRCPAVGLAVPAEWPVPGEASGAVARGVVGCVESDCGTHGELLPGPPGIVLSSRAT
ncbi:hypothetical protein ACFY1B_20255 [Streptomyces mirabilis]|uniref:hypothetical protein n=1 Tax=Streptomyces mirabilis TaxID=68239 RepID=UPI003679C1D0